MLFFLSPRISVKRAFYVTFVTQINKLYGEKENCMAIETLHSTRISFVQKKTIYLLEEEVKNLSFSKCRRCMVCTFIERWSFSGIEQWSLFIIAWHFAAYRCQTHETLNLDSPCSKRKHCVHWKCRLFREKDIQIYRLCDHLKRMKLVGNVRTHHTAYAIESWYKSFSLFLFFFVVVQSAHWLLHIVN